jgi:hypothetical protein
VKFSSIPIKLAAPALTLTIYIYIYIYIYIIYIYLCFFFLYNNNIIIKSLFKIELNFINLLLKMTHVRCFFIGERFDKINVIPQLVYLLR